MEDVFDFDEQRENLERVTARIGRVIIAFYSRRMQTVDRTFYMRDLEDIVKEEIGDHGVAPDSTSRILRSLRQRGLLRYRVLSRAQSWYELLPMDEVEDIPA